jgi:hypothetical protein
MKVNSKIFFQLVSLIFLGSNCTASLAQVALPALVSGDELQSIKGSTVNRNASVGGSSSLEVGSSTTFGASVSVNSSPGTKGKASSLLKLNEIGSLKENRSCPTGGCLRSSIGGSDSTLTGTITNLRATDATEFNETDIASGSNTYASGNVSFTGIAGENNLVLDESSEFNASTESIDANVPGATPSDTKISSASSSATIDTTTTSDIKSSSFTSTFQQAF